jgi:hypothetical protein
MSSDCIAELVNKTWLCSRYPRCHHLLHDNGSKFKLHFNYFCKSYGIKCKPNTAKFLQENAILGCVHKVLLQMQYTTEIDMAKSITPNDVDVILDKCSMGNLLYLSYSTQSLARCSHFWTRQLFDIPFMVDWHKIGEHRQSLTDRINQRKNNF